MLNDAKNNIAAGVRELRLQLPSREQLLFDRLSLQIEQGQKVLLLGPSGSGKSTLLKILTGLIPETIEMAVSWEERKSFASWGYVFQDPDSQFCMPYVDEEIAFVLENLGVPRSEMPERIQHYLQLVDLYFENNNRPISTLSQGQKQRLALASTLALEPETLVLDEPTALLDPFGTRKIWEHVRQVSRDKTLLVVEHQIDEVIDFVDRVVVLNEEGALIADDSPENIQRLYRPLLDRYGIWHAESWSDRNRKPADVTLPKRLSGGEDESSLLHIDNLKGYRDDKVRIELSNLCVQPGEWIAVTGPNGAGKSTLLLALMQLLETEGRCCFEGEIMKKTEELASDIGFVFQNPELQFVARSVYEEVAFTLVLQKLTVEETEVQVKRCLKQFGLAELADENPYQLSTGQQRRLSVASSVVAERKLLLLDEPTFGQDAASTFAILEELESCRKAGTSLLMVTHDPKLVQRYATRIWEIKDGRLNADYPGQRAQELADKGAGYAI